MYLLSCKTVVAWWRRKEIFQYHRDVSLPSVLGGALCSLKGENKEGAYMHLRFFDIKHSPKMPYKWPCKLFGLRAGLLPLQFLLTLGLVQRTSSSNFSECNKWLVLAYIFILFLCEMQNCTKISYLANCLHRHFNIEFLQVTVEGLN